MVSLTVLTTWLKHTVYVLFHALSSDVTVYVTPPFEKSCTEPLAGVIVAPSVSEKMGCCVAHKKQRRNRDVRSAVNMYGR